MKFKRKWRNVVFRSTKIDKKKLFKRARDLKSKGIGTKIDINYFL